MTNAAAETIGVPGAGIHLEDVPVRDDVAAETALARLRLDQGGIKAAATEEEERDKAKEKRVYHNRKTPPFGFFALHQI